MTAHDATPAGEGVKFGLLLSHQYPFEEDLGQRLRELFELVELGRDLGYDSAWTIHHYLANLQTPQPISMTAALSRVSGDMMLGTCILLAPFLHPVHIAEEFATIDHLTGGRAVLGLGAGYRPHEFEAFGLAESERFGRMVETVELVRQLWSGEEVHHRGKYFTVEGQRSGVLPCRPGGPPIWLGGGGKQSVRRAARLGDAWWAPGTSPNRDYPLKAIALHDEALAEAGKSRDGREYPIGLELFCGATDESALEDALPYVRKEFFTYGEHYDYLSWQKDHFDTLLDNSFVLGSPETVVRRIRVLVDAGYNHIVFRPFWIGMPAAMARESVTRIAHEVMPHFRS